MAEEIVKCRDDIVYFALTYVYIFDPQTYQTFRFEPWDFQPNVLRTFAHDSRVIILKGRQLGISWCIGIAALHRAMFYNNSNVLMISKREDEAQKLLNKADFIYENLPKWMKDARPVISDNKKSMQIEKRNSKGFITHTATILALPSTKDAGRSETASIVFADEWAFHKYASENWSAITPTIDHGGQFIGVSTANGLGNFYHQMWQQSERHKNGFRNIFLPYNLRPGRDEEWYEATKATYPDQRDFHREYPRNAAEAFISTGGCIFDLEGLQWMADEICEDAQQSKEIGNLGLRELCDTWREVKVWREPIPGEQYVVGVDPAGGVGGDPSAAVFLDLEGKQVAAINGNLDPDAFSSILAQVSHKYNDAYAVVERNNHGHAVLSALKNEYAYGNLFIFRKKKREGEGDNREGFPTNTKTKPVSEARMQVWIRDRLLYMRDMDFVSEAQAYVRRNGKSGAEEGSHDDRVDAAMLALVGIEAYAEQRRRPVRRMTPKKHFRTRHIN